ncbi:PepSY-associated TM helix domain-containing protein [Prosthecobacter sp.]|uniref:PepSY-associated TM helix domain-containing protein n=1 Tax=Prosthecobacter sp. TaxID=1965333 RepID=UPI00378504BA
MIRKLLFWSHLIIGLLTGLFIFLLCLTGAILAFELQIVDYAERESRALPPFPNAQLLSPQALLTKLDRQTTGPIQYAEWFADPGMPVRIVTKNRTVALLNGYTGASLGSGATTLRAFMLWTTKLHTNLTTGPIGNWLISIANAAFAFLILSGLWLWWPRQWRWKALRNSLAIRFDVTGKARDWNWHNALGFWFLIPLLFICLTGIVMSFRPVDQWWRSFGGTQVLGPSIAPTKPAPHPEPATTWPAWMHRIQQQYPGWRSILLQNGASPNQNGLLALTVKYGTFRQVTRSLDIKFDTRGGQIIEERGWSSGDGSGRARSIARLGHTGEFFGTWGQWAALLSCLAGLVLVYTGLALSWRRFFRPGALAQ